MKSIQTLFLSTILLFAACKKSTQNPTDPHYPQYYSLVYFKANDSAVAYAAFAGKSAMRYYDNRHMPITVNGKQPDSINIETQSYLWYDKGLKDAVFAFSSNGSNLINTVKAADVKVYDFYNLPDTVSLKSWKSVRWQGPSANGDAGFRFEIYFSDGTTQSAYIYKDTTAFVFPADFPKTKPGGKTKCILTWWGTEKPLQMINIPVEEGSLSTSSVTEKYIWLVP